MAATINWDGYGRVSNADSTSGWGILKILGTGGTPSVALADGAIEGSGSVGTTVNKQRIVMYYDIGAGNELDFTGGGAEEGQMVYAWANFLASSLLNNQSAGGMGIFLCSGSPATNNYHLWYFYGADNYAGGWKRMVLDPTETVSASAGTLDLSSVRYFGCFADVGGRTAKFENLNVDAIDVGTGLLVTGTSTTDDLMGDLLEDELTNRYGIVTALNDSATSLELNGKLTLGDDVGTAATALTDVNKKIFLAEPSYYQGGVTTAVPSSFFAINQVGNGTGATSVTIGKKVGSGDAAKGRSGYAIVGNSSYTLGMDLDDGNVNASKWYGTSLESVTGAIALGTNTAHEFIGNSLTDCSTVDLGSVIARALTFTNTEDQGTGKYAALDWDGSGATNIKNSNFIANTDADAGIAHAIRHDTAGTFSYDGLLFSGNEKDVWFTPATGNLTIQKNSGSDPSTSTNDSTGTVAFTASFTHTLTNLAENSEVTYVKVSDGSVLHHVENVPVSGQSVYTHSGGETVDILIHHLDYLPDISCIYNLTLPNGNASVQVAQFDDPNYVNP